MVKKGTYQYRVEFFSRNVISYVIYNVEARTISHAIDRAIDRIPASSGYGDRVRKIFEASDTAEDFSEAMIKYGYDYTVDLI